MKRVSRICDKCGKDLGEHNGALLYFLGERQSDPAGGHSERDEFGADLCPEHMLMFFARVRKEFDLDKGLALLNLWKEFVRK